MLTVVDFVLFSIDNSKTHQDGDTDDDAAADIDNETKIMCSNNHTTTNSTATQTK